MRRIVQASTVHVLLSVGGFVAAVAGIGLTFGVGPALMVGGVVAFVAGGLASREARR